MILIVDSWAWLAATESEEIADKSLKYINDRKNLLYTTYLNIYEVYYRIKEQSNEEEARKFVESIKNRAIIMNIDEELSLLAGNIHLNEKMSAVDAFVYAAAIKVDGKVLTGDPHFKGKESVIFIE